MTDLLTLMEEAGACLEHQLTDNLREIHDYLETLIHAGLKDLDPPVHIEERTVLEFLSLYYGPLGPTAFSNLLDQAFCKPVSLYTNLNLTLDELARALCEIYHDYFD